jgi:hypothetical protein
VRDLGTGDELNGEWEVMGWRIICKRTATVCKHASCSCEFVFVETLLLHGLLGDYIAGSEENLSTALISIVSLLVSSIQAPTYAAAHLRIHVRSVGAGSRTR